MADFTRRSVLRGSLGLAAAGTLARPYIANAAASTAEVWFAQGFAKEEDASLKKLVAEYAARPIMTGGKAVIGGLIIAITAITAATIVGRGTAGRQAISPMAATITGDKPGQARRPRVRSRLRPGGRFRTSAL